MSVRWFMALFKRRPHVSPDAAICFNPASFFQLSPLWSQRRNQQKLTLGSHLLTQSVFCGSSLGCVCFRGTWRGGWGWVGGASPVLRWQSAEQTQPSSVVVEKHASDIEKWHATRMPLITFRGKVGKMADVTRPSYQPNFIRGIHVWAGKSGYFSSSFIL